CRIGAALPRIAVILALYQVVESKRLPDAPIGLDRQGQFRTYDKIAAGLQPPVCQGNFETRHLYDPDPDIQPRFGRVVLPIRVRLILAHCQDLNPQWRMPRGNEGPLVVVLERQIVKHSLPRLRGYYNAVLPRDALLLAGDGLFDLPRHGQESARLRKVRVVGW